MADRMIDLIAVASIVMLAVSVFLANGWVGLLGFMGALLATAAIWLAVHRSHEDDT